MNRTDFAQHLAPVAAAPRPRAGFGIGYQWRSVVENLVNCLGLMSADATTNATTKRTARRLGMATT